MSRGGARPGAGKKKGSLASHTLEAQEAKKALIEAYREKSKEINEALISKAVTGDIPAIKEIHDRVWGKAPQALEMTGKDGKDLIPEPTDKIKDLAKMLNEIHQSRTGSGG